MRMAVAVIIFVRVTVIVLLRVLVRVIMRMGSVAHDRGGVEWATPLLR